jgi:TonB family protein
VHLNRSAVTVATLLFAAACATNPGPGKKGDSALRSTAEGFGCIDTLFAADTLSTIIKMTVASQDSEVRLPRDFESLFVEEFRSHFKVPASLPLSVVVGAEPCDSIGSRCAGGVLSVGAVAYATAHNDGKLSDIAVVDVAQTRLFADSVSSALRVMSDAWMVPPIGGADSVPIIMRILPEEEPDTVPDVRYVFKAKVPQYDWPFTYASMPAVGVDAKYPFTARLAGVADSVTLGFTVEADGTIAAESIELVSANYRDFVSSVLEALTQTRYHPAHLGDCAVATRMKQRFLFKLPK